MLLKCHPALLGVQFIYAEAPRLKEDKGWWRHAKVSSGAKGRETSQYQGLDASVLYLRDLLKEHSPVQGVIGLSQGGALAGLLSGAMVADRFVAPGDGVPPLRFKWAVICSGHVCHDPRVAHLYRTPKKVVQNCADCGISLAHIKTEWTCARCEQPQYCSKSCKRHHWDKAHKKECANYRQLRLASGVTKQPQSYGSSAVVGERLNVPTLHTICSDDQIVPPRQSEALAESFEDPEIIYHTEGHVIPQEGETLRRIVSWVVKRLPEDKFESHLLEERSDRHLPSEKDVDDNLELAGGGHEASHEATIQRLRKKTDERLETMGVPTQSGPWLQWGEMTSKCASPPKASSAKQVPASQACKGNRG